MIAPAIARCRARGIDVSGPFPADTIFVRARRGEFDVVIACYHDQGLIPVKLVAFGRAVNVTLGLPIIRTSVDHGTAFDIAGRGVADAESMIAAVLLAARLREVGLMAEKTERELAQAQHRGEPQGVPRLPPARDLRGRHRAARHRGQGDPRGPREPARQLRARRERRGVSLQRQHQPVQPPGVRRTRAAAAPQAAAAPRRDPQADWQDGRKGHDARADAPVLQERTRQGGHRPREGQEGVRQARDDQRREADRETRAAIKTRR